MDEAARVMTEPAAAKEVRLFGLGAFFLRRFRERSAEAFREIDGARLAQLRLSLACGLLYVAVLVAGFWYVGARAGDGRLTLGDVALYVAAMIQAQSRLTFLAQVYGFMRQALLGLRRLFSFLDGAGPRVALAERGRPAPAGPAEMALAHIAFSYGSAGAPVLEDVSAHLMPSGVTALVGANGVGKSTLVKLLTRMHDPVAGVITLDGAALADYDLISWHRRIAAAHQDFARFALTLRENIAVGGVTPEDGGVTPEDGGVTPEDSAAAVERAAGWAGADEIAARLPHGYETGLTRRFEGGVDLSGGEWQTVALARAFVRNAGLVLLDEPTAALDADAEERLVARLRALMVGRTALLISHRFSTVRLADRILVLDGGRIVEEGTHADLLAANGRYAAWYEMQAGRYRDGAPSAEDAHTTPT